MSSSSRFWITSTAQHVLARAPGDQPIPIGARERREPEAKLVGAVPA